MSPSLGVSVASRSGLSAAQFAALACVAEQGGLDGFHIAEVAADAMTLAQTALAATDRITVGTAITSMRLRHPVAMAMSAAVLGETFGGRFTLGLGLSSPAFTEQRLGLPPVRPLSFVTEYVATVRAVLTGDPMSTGLVLDHPPTVPVPVHVAAMLPRMLALAGAIGDGVILSATTAGQVATAVDHVRAGAAQAGRATPEIVTVVPCCLDEPAVAQAAARSTALTRLGNPAAVERAARAGHSAAVARVSSALQAGDRAAAEEAVTPELGGEFLLTDRDALQALLAAPTDHVALFPVVASVDSADWLAAIERSIDLLGSLRAGALVRSD